MTFSADERKILLGIKGVGPTVIARLEQLGYFSLAKLAGADATEIVKGAATLVGSSCWKNSPQAKAAIQAAISVARAHGQAVPSSTPPPLPSPPPSLPSPNHTNANAVAEMEQLANLGPKSAALLVAAGVQSFSHLQQLGAVAAYAQAKRYSSKVSLNLLWALEGALTGQPWQTVAREHRTSLLLALEAYENDN